MENLTAKFYDLVCETKENLDRLETKYELLVSYYEELKEDYEKKTGEKWIDGWE